MAHLKKRFRDMMDAAKHYNMEKPLLAATTIIAQNKMICLLPELAE